MTQKHFSLAEVELSLKKIFSLITMYLSLRFNEMKTILPFKQDGCVLPKKMSVLNIQ